MWRYYITEAVLFLISGTSRRCLLLFTSSLPMWTTCALINDPFCSRCSLFWKRIPSPALSLSHIWNKLHSTVTSCSFPPMSLTNCSNLGAAVTGSSLLRRNNFKWALGLAILSCTPIIRIQLQTSNYRKSRVWECQTIISWFTSLLIGRERSYYCLMTWKQCKIDDSSGTSLWYDVIDFLSNRELGLPVLPRILTRYVGYFLFHLIMRKFKCTSTLKKYIVCVQILSPWKVTIL